MQHLLFEQHEEYMPGLLGDYNWQSVEVQNAMDKVYREFDTLAIIRKTPKLIVFSENFFGRHVVRQKHEFETLLKQHTSRFEDTIFAINYLCTERTDVPIAEVDRTINFILAANEFSNLSKSIYTYDENLNVLQKFLLSKVTPSFIDIISTLSLYLNSRFESYHNVDEYITYLNNIIQKAKSEYLLTNVLQNITSYFYDRQILMQYNKATYYNEVDNLLMKNTQNYYLYKFGLGIDIISQLSKMSTILHDNVSTEICRDVVVKTRSRDQKIRVHVVQSDYININDCFDNFPEYEVLIHADSYNSCLYIGRQAQPQSFEYTINYGSRHCAIKCFMLE